MDLYSVIRRNLYCCYMMEKMVTDVFDKYADVMKHRSIYISTVLNAIALESKKHAELLGFLAKQFDLFEETDCAQFVGEPWVKTQRVLDRLSLGEEMDLKSFLETQIWIEGAIGEETYHKILLPLLIKCINVNCLKEETAKTLEVILRKIVKDEKWHEEVLMKLAEHKF
ncbi:MAG: hypothetical protein QXH10_10065 [Ignisphaera sp.]|uniref:Ferritin-like domain-containing protein n=1 Tax=Ignisphaera aggregans TaxID=334771 RepID=A0A7C4JLH0_9CREN